MAELVLFCRRCGEPVKVLGRVSPVCAACGKETTYTMPPPARSLSPTVPYTLSYNDCRLLKALRIDPEANSYLGASLWS